MDSTATANTNANANEPLFTGKEQTIYDGLVPRAIYQPLLKASVALPWRYGWNTPANPTARYWHHEVGFGNKQNTECISDNVRKHPLKALAEYQQWVLSRAPHGTKMLRFYFNAYTYGTDGWPHTDTEREGEQTAVLYLTDRWQPAWAGETVVFDDAGDVALAALPRRNRIITFPSNALHAPRPLARAFTGLRVVLVVKLGMP
ncbi:2OG-Fe(II) oxygenase [Gammaproteobacteria bacterium LSUCC0057]|uniref:2OG-Fe(II) oxygenase n=1 Tax=Gammaproteobacteria bacterium LSUCC0057 TaxID=2559237 RepID=A0A4Y8UH95_9GAMM|nr:2OG-Fe(II) oxygenase [Gammaproteobacteria bacterium LSUCC0057]